MFGSITFDVAIYYVILGISLSYLYKAAKQILTKDITFYRQEIYTDESVEKWSIVDGLLKCSTALVCFIYGLLNIMVVSDKIWYVIVVFAINIILYLVLYRKILKKKDVQEHKQNILK